MSHRSIHIPGSPTHSHSSCEKRDHHHYCPTSHLRDHSSPHSTCIFRAKGSPPPCPTAQLRDYELPLTFKSSFLIKGTITTTVPPLIPGTRISHSVEFLLLEQRDYHHHDCPTAQFMDQKVPLTLILPLDQRDYHHHSPTTQPSDQGVPFTQTPPLITKGLPPPLSHHLI